MINHEGGGEEVTHCEIQEIGVLWLYRVNREDQEEMAARKQIFLKQGFGGEVVLGEVKVQVDMKEVRVKVTGTENKGL